MKYLVDSDYVADYLSARPHTTHLLPSLLTEGMSISLITFGEIYEGIYYAYDPQKTEEVFQRFLRSVPVLPLTMPIMQKFSRLRGELRRQGNMIGDFDIIIAATAMYHSLTLITRNRRDFERISHLKLYQTA